MTEPLRDYMGTQHEPAPKARILSLVPSLTELLYDLGIGSHLVGRTHFCIHPKEPLADIPSVGGTKKIKMDRVRDLSPTHALVNVDENPRDMAQELTARGINVVVTHPQHPDDNIPLYRLIGGLFGAEGRAEELISEFKDAQASISQPHAYPQRKALYLIWKDPWMAVTPRTYIANTLALVSIALETPGADPALKGDAARYPEVALSNETLGNLDLVLFSSEPYAFGKTDIAAFAGMFPEHAHKAHLIDGEMTSWYGSRAIRGLQYIRDFAYRIGA